MFKFGAIRIVFLKILTIYTGTGLRINVLCTTGIRIRVGRISGITRVGRSGIRVGRSGIRAGRSGIRVGRISGTRVGRISGIRVGRSGIRAGRSGIRVGRISGTRVGRSGIRVGRSGIRAGRSGIRVGRISRIDRIDKISADKIRVFSYDNIVRMPQQGTHLIQVTVHISTCRL